MKGQHLFVRLARPEDLSEIRSFYQSEHLEDPSVSIDPAGPPAEGGVLIGKLVGDIVAHLRFSRSHNTVRIESIHVARLLRRKRIGRLMISELARLSGIDGAKTIEAPAEGDAAGFFHAVGFERSSKDTMLTMKITLRED
ncbi:MAG: GNAT family N-acetyltransferase, partial [Acidobacteria bacterium]|nr:GNAT family N-acetyltransferase [Acidobacteriota bacterium]